MDVINRIERAAAALSVAACIPCLAQQAPVVVSHNDPDGIVAPAETAQISATVSWTGAWLLDEIMGDVRSTSDVGIASNSTYPHSWYASNQNTIVNPGVPNRRVGARDAPARVRECLDPHRAFRDALEPNQWL